MHFADQWWWWSFQQQELLVIVSPSLIMLAEFQKESISFKASVTLKRFILSLFVILIEIWWSNHHYYFDRYIQQMRVDEIEILTAALLSAVHCVNKCKNAWFYIQWSWPIFFYFYWKLQKHSTWDNVLENLIQQLVFLPREILQCGGRKSILMKLLVCLCLQIQTKAVASDRLKLQTSGRLATISYLFHHFHQNSL